MRENKHSFPSVQVSDIKPRTEFIISFTRCHSLCLKGLFPSSIGSLVVLSELTFFPPIKSCQVQELHNRLLSFTSRSLAVQTRYVLKPWSNLFLPFEQNVSKPRLLRATRHKQSFQPAWPSCLLGMKLYHNIRLSRRKGSAYVTDTACESVAFLQPHAVPDYSIFIFIKRLLTVLAVFFLRLNLY